MKVRWAVLLAVVCAAALLRQAAAQGIGRGIVLTGIVELPATTNSSVLKRAFLEIDSVSYSLSEGQRSGAVEVLRIDSSDGKVTLRYGREVFELSFAEQANRRQAALAVERQKDVSHTEYHTARARLDRQRDAAQRSK